MTRLLSLVRILALLVILCCPTTSVFAQDGDVLTNSDVVAMVKVGLSEGIILAKIKQTKSNFDTTPSGLAKLKESGVPDAITIVMIEGKQSPQERTDLILDDSLGEIAEAVAKKKAYVETADEKARQEILQILNKNNFSIVTNLTDAELLFKLTSIKVERTMGGGGLVVMTNTVEVEMGKLSVYLLREKQGNLIFLKEKKNTFPAKHLYTQAKSFTEDFVEELRKAERKKLKK